MSTETTINLPAPPQTSPRCEASATSAGLVMIHGPDIGRMHTIPTSTSLLIGRDESNNICLEESSVSRVHARLMHDGRHVHVLDLGSTNGTFVNDCHVEHGILKDSDMLNIGRIIFKFLMGAGVEAAYHKALYRLTTTDPLTDTYNKRYLLENLERELSRAMRQGTDVSLVMFDIDRFKRINDTYGHLIGDFILRQVAGRVHGRIRQEDLFARYGGEEFALMLPGINKANATHFAQALRLLMTDAPFEAEQHIVPVTISLGVASLAELAAQTSGRRPTPEWLIETADQRLYEAKRSGRNRVVCA
ncbi:MAG: GGDEF domain-containing protein [Myxococcota bacterium]